MGASLAGNGCKRVGKPRKKLDERQSLPCLSCALRDCPGVALPACPAKGASLLAGLAGLALSCALAGLLCALPGLAVLRYGKGLIGLRRASRRLVGLARFRHGLPSGLAWQACRACLALPSAVRLVGLGLSGLSGFRLSAWLSAYRPAWHAVRRTIRKKPLPATKRQTRA